jgi:Ca2+-binding EF-hand superfamily protein
MDRNGDGYFSKDDLPALARSRWDSDRLTQLRRDFDKNRDGRISRAEFVGGPMPMFEAADSNRDNQVSKAELQALGQKAKAR